MSLRLLPSRVKLFHKQLALVAVVLAFELGLFVSLLVLLNQAEAEARRSEQAYVVISDVNQLVKTYTDAVTALIGFGLTRSRTMDRQFSEACAVVPSEVSELKASSADFPEDRERLQHVLAVTHNLLDMLLFYRKELQGANLASHVTTPLTLMRLNTEVRPGLLKLSSTVVAFNENHKRVQLLQQQRRERLRNLLNWAVIIGGSMQVVIAVVSVLFFSRSIAKRLDTVADNAFRLATGQQLLPRMKGEDEIAHLDSVFHGVARALTDASNRERAIVDGMPVGFLTLNQQGLIRSVNPRALSVLKANDADQLVGKKFVDMVLTAGGDGATFEQIKEATQGRVHDLQLRTFDGHSFPAELSISCISESNEQILICNILDVSERYEIERMKQEFVEIVSHDLKTPLTSLQGSLHMLGRGVLGTLNDRGKELVDGMQHETKRLMRLVTDLLDIAKMEAGRMDLDCESIDVEAVASTSVNAASAPADAKSIKLTCDCAELKIFADQDRLVQVLINLLTNAIKFAPSKSEVVLTCAMQDNMAEFKVIDHGPGIPQDAQGQIFERFHQVAGERAIQKQGTGLGLAICKLIVEAHGGTIGVQSTAGNGATFWFTVPLSSSASSIVDVESPAAETANQIGS
ncbi:MAG TPA: ATP-binding protein [Trichormus sp.]